MQKIGKNHELIQKLKEIKKNTHSNRMIIDDIEILNLILRYHLKIEYLLYSYEEQFKEDTQKLLNQLTKETDNVYEISQHTYEIFQSKENHVGILAVVQVPQYEWTDLKDFVLVLDHLEIPGNIGTIYRTLDSCGATGVLLVDPISKITNPKILAASRGTSLILPTKSCSYQEALDYLINHNYTIYLGEPNLGSDYQSYQYQGKIAIVVGNERFGINPDWYQHPHQKVFIPMKGNNNSINVGVAASILVYEAAMKRKNF